MSRLHQRAIEAGKLIETTNALSAGEFFEKYCNSNSITKATLEIRDLVGKDVELIAVSAEGLRPRQNGLLDACFGLIESSSAADYKASSMKWSPSGKRREMLLPDMKYLILQDKEASVEGGLSRRIVGFTSFMVTYEDSYEVIYLYEIHLQPSLQGQGVGKILVNIVEEIGREVNLEKCMLTVFRANKRAVKWYDRIGYTLDDFSPGPRVMRNGTVKESSYVILSKPLL